MSWNTFKQNYLSINPLDFALDYSRIRFSDRFFQDNEERIQSAFSAMDALEAGSIANPDEGRQVGHYWLRNAQLAPDSETQKAIMSSLDEIDSIVEKVHSGSFPEKKEHLKIY